MSLIKLIKKQQPYNTDESWSTFANLSFNRRKKKRKRGKIKGEKSRGEKSI